MRIRRHPNGQVVIAWCRRDGGQTRFHYWPRDVGWSEVHNHRYDFESRVLLGELEEELFRVQSGGSHRVVRETSGPGQDYVFVDVGPCEIERVGSRRHSRRRLVDGDEFHRVRPVGRTLTLVRAMPLRRDFSTIIRERTST